MGKTDNINHTIFKNHGRGSNDIHRTEKKFPLVISGNIKEQLALQPDLRLSECNRLNSDPQNDMSVPRSVNVISFRKTVFEDIIKLRVLR